MRADPAQLATVVEALAVPELAHVVDLVVHAEYDPAEPGRGPVAVVVTNRRGAVRLRSSAGGAGPEQHELLHGEDPVALTDPLAFLPYPLERADPGPPNARNHYPEPARRLLSFFADPDRSPDLAIVHTPRHFFPEQGGHRGEHGSLDVIQSRAPFLLSGAGVPVRGVVDGHVRTVDVAPTLLHLAGVGPQHHLDATGAALDGRARTELLDGAVPAARFVVGVLWDGAHCSDLLHLATTGRLPAVRRLLDRGLACSGGAIAEFPSVTLCNHTSALTGVGPGRHGILGNVFHDRSTGRQILANDETSWHRSAEWLRPQVRTVFEMLAAARPETTSACIDEPIDRGATSSTMQLIRAGGDARGAGALDDLLPAAQDSPYLGDPGSLSDDYYRWGTRVDDAGLIQMLQAFADPAQAPGLTWWSNVVTDAGHHAGGPRSAIARGSLQDADRRLGAFLDHLEAHGVLDDVAFLLTADHGFEAADPAVTGTWTPALDDVTRRLGLTYRDEGPGLVYLDRR